MKGLKGHASSAAKPAPKPRNCDGIAAGLLMKKRVEAVAALSGASQSIGNSDHRDPSPDRLKWG